MCMCVGEELTGPQAGCRQPCASHRKGGTAGSRSFASLAGSPPPTRAPWSGTDAERQALRGPGPAPRGRHDARRRGDRAGRARGRLPRGARLCGLAARGARLPRPRRLVPHAGQPGAPLAHAARGVGGALCCRGWSGGREHAGSWWTWMAGSVMPSWAGCAVSVSGTRPSDVSWSHTDRPQQRNVSHEMPAAAGWMGQRYILG